MCPVSVHPIYYYIFQPAAEFVLQWYGAGVPVEVYEYYEYYIRLYICRISASHLRTFPLVGPPPTPSSPPPPRAFGSTSSSAAAGARLECTYSVSECMFCCRGPIVRFEREIVTYLCVCNQHPHSFTSNIARAASMRKYAESSLIIAIRPGIARFVCMFECDRPLVCRFIDTLVCRQVEV